jgi:Kef-type K+ transport system membrane component KefB
MRTLEQVSEPSFDDVLWTLLFMTSVWIGGKAAARLGMPGLVGEIAVGISMGPHGADLVPAADALMLYGEVGLMLLVLEAGLDVDLAMLKLIGPRGMGVALSGSLAPLSIGAAIAFFGFGQDWKASLAVGCTLAPTSMGIALNVLKGGGVLNTPTGQLVIAAAVLDDVIALVLLAELRSLDDPTLLKLLVPVISSVGLMICVGWLGVFVTPQLTAWCLPLIKPKMKNKASCYVTARRPVALARTVPSGTWHAP